MKIKQLALPPNDFFLHFFVLNVLSSVHYTFSSYDKNLTKI